MNLDEYNLYFPHYNINNEERFNSVLTEEFEDYVKSNYIFYSEDFKLLQELYTLYFSTLKKLSYLTKDPDIFLCNFKLDIKDYREDKKKLIFGPILGAPFDDFCIKLGVSLKEDEICFDLGLFIYSNEEGETFITEITTLDICEILKRTEDIEVIKREYYKLIEPAFVKELTKKIPKMNNKSYFEVLVEYYQTEVI